jgi:hypothetical protein
MYQSEVIEYIHAKRQDESHGIKGARRWKEEQEKAQDAPFTQAIQIEFNRGQIF